MAGRYGMVRARVAATATGVALVALLFLRLACAGGGPTGDGIERDSAAVRPPGGRPTPVTSSSDTPRAPFAAREPREGRARAPSAEDAAAPPIAAALPTAPAAAGPESGSDATRADPRTRAPRRDRAPGPESPLGAFQEVTAPPGLEGELFARDVAIDGDVAVAASPARLVGARGRAFVLERIDGVWRISQELAPPGASTVFALRVACAASRVAVFGGFPTDRGHGFATFVRDDRGAWVPEQVVPAPVDSGTDVAMTADWIAVATKRDLLLWRRAGGVWEPQGSPFDPPSAGAWTQRWAWVALSGGTLASRDPAAPGETNVRALAFEHGAWTSAAALASNRRRDDTGRLGGGGAWLAVLDDEGVFSAAERTAEGWSDLAPVTRTDARHGDARYGLTVTAMAADGDLAVVAAWGGDSIQVLRRTTRGWTTLRIGLPSSGAKRQRTIEHPAVAVSGRTVLLGAIEQKGAERSLLFLELDAAELDAAPPVVPPRGR